MRRASGTLLLLAVLAGCGTSGGGANGRLQVVATTTQAADLARNVGGTRVEVKGLLRPSADPHDYEPRPSDARAVADARVVFRSGGDVDSWLGQVVGQAGGEATEMTLADSVRRRGDDPHWWQDPRNAELASGAIRRGLTKADPAGRRLYARNAAAYQRRLRRLDAGIARCIAKVPPPERKVVTSHDSLGYFGARYGVKIVGAVIPSLSSQAQPSARDVERLVGQIRREHVKAIFPESALNPKLERAVARESGARVAGTLWADALGPPGSDGHTYLAAEASNARRLVTGMTGGRLSCRLAP
jgi:zinc/manganese transport system substrate-binding protein